MKHTLTIVGLGPGSPDLLTRQASQVLENCHELLVSSVHHPVLQALKKQRKLVVLNDGDADSIVRQILSRQIADVVYAAPGNPLEDDSVSRLLVEQADLKQWSTQLVAGVSFLDLTFQALRLTRHAPGMQVVDAAELSLQSENEKEPPFDVFAGVYRTVDPTRPLIVEHVDSRSRFEAVRRTFATLYPDDQPVEVVSIEIDSGAIRMEEIELAKIASSLTDDRRVIMYVKPVERLKDVAAFDTLRYIVARLRAPNGCPWDREQTYQSMKKHLLEETYEAISALDNGDLQQFASELGDVLLQVVMHSQLGREAREFDLEDVLRAVNTKLIRRHPHVFGDVQVASSADVLRNWERIKRTEGQGAVSTFSGVPEAAPSLMRADAVQSRATRYGWIPPSTGPALAGIEQPGLSADEFKTQLGDLLFGLVALARRRNVDAEEAVRLATNRFCAALDQVLVESQNQGLAFDSLDAEERQRRVERAMSQAG